MAADATSTSPESKRTKYEKKYGYSSPSFLDSGIINRLELIASVMYDSTLVVLFTSYLSLPVSISAMAFELNT